MKCDLCGSEKNVRQFAGIRGKYTECRKCFEKAMKLGVSMLGGKLTKEILESEWNRGTNDRETD